MRKLKMYIDGFNLYHAIAQLNNPQLKWLNPVKLAESFLRPGEELVGVDFFTAISTADGAKYKRHFNYIQAIESVRVKTYRGHFQNIDKICTRHDRRCPFREEKRTDVAIAVKAVSDAFDGRFDRMILVTADADQVPVIEQIRDRFPEKTVTMAVPPGRLNIAYQLCSLAHEYRELKAGRLKACMFPRSVYDAKGKFVAAMPAIYIPAVLPLPPCGVNGFQTETLPNSVHSSRQRPNVLSRWKHCVFAEEP
jgi:uncharacterized LabA/DUF88 family protein